MNNTSKNSIMIRNTKLGGKHTLICVPIMEDTIKESILACERASLFNPDMVEARIDKIIDTDKEIIPSMLLNMRKILADKPLIATYRSVTEGGWGNMPPREIFELYKEIIEESDVDILDIEMSLDRKIISELQRLCKEKGIKVMFSHHNFEDTPNEPEILSILKEGERLGGDISKIALMPNNGKDVLKLLNATYTAKTELSIPFVAISMGKKGKISRMGAGVFGSSITFAQADHNPSAPGQIGIQEMRAILNCLEE
ncbi:MAG TPA: type I 3-dehydroquinate dehydratase [Eubacteriaceae bacterium]|jgi:3-dehydroquinate dehydratase-1|nr:type I 3-dehydroquinate dehydratase [Eubacteriaceae bacterium]